MFELPALATIPRAVYLSIFYTSVMYFLYNVVSFNILLTFLCKLFLLLFVPVLEGVSPVTHAIANCCKRLFIIVVSIIVFGTVIQPLNIIGSLIAVLPPHFFFFFFWAVLTRVQIFGVAVYSQLSSGIPFYLHHIQLN
jgi:hypothetical protein